MNDAHSGVSASQPQRPRNGLERIGDLEREAACEQLIQHFVLGRLNQADLDHRVALATQAETQSHLIDLLSDLPAPETTTTEARPQQTVPRIARPPTAARIAGPLAVAIISCLGLLGILTYSAGEASSITYYPANEVFAYVLTTALLAVTAGTASTVLAHRYAVRWRTRIADELTHGGPDRPSPAE